MRTPKPILLLIILKDSWSETFVVPSFKLKLLPCINWAYKVIVSETGNKKPKPALKPNTALLKSSWLFKLITLLFKVCVPCNKKATEELPFI